MHRVCDWKVDMNILDCVEIWLRSLRVLFEGAGTTVRFDRVMDARPNPSCALNLRLDLLEADLVVWESGEAELALVAADGSTNQEHFDDLRAPQELAKVLARLVDFLPLARSK